ncbi:MAG: sigma-54 dependent transcriptional regulator [Pirellulaceae bacterium]|nr:sigma-54-dependent Fis family transcriptional regulator [Planctomycetales bacterium]
MPVVLVVDDDRSVRHIIKGAFAGTEHTVLEAADVEDALRLVRDQTPDVVFLDIELPEISGLEAFDKIKALDGKLPVIYITGGGTSNTAIEAMKLGAFDYLLKPLNLAQLRELAARAFEIRRLMKVPVALSSAVSPADFGDQIVGRSSQMQEVFKAIGRVAPQNVTVLIRGESGTGKELVARAIYQHGDRRDAPFLAVNCAAIPEQLLESELFGHEKGAFTGADRQRIGKFEQCNGGTIFLDEIGDMPAMLQSKILRLLQQQEFQRVGGNETIKTDVRIVAATNRNLEQMVADGQFREDLLYRLNGYSICLPPLRDRGDDTTILVQHYLARLSREIKREVQGLAPSTLTILRAYHWPGNVRELEGVLRQTLLQMTGTIIAPEFLPNVVTAGRPAIEDADTLHSGENDTTAPQESTTPASCDGDTTVNCLPFDLREFIRGKLGQTSDNLYAETLEMMELYLLTQVLTQSNGNQSEAARILGITRGSLRHKIRSLGINIGSKIETTE